MLPAGFEPAMPTSKRPQTQALDRAATGIGIYTHICIHTHTHRFSPQECPLYTCRVLTHRHLTLKQVQVTESEGFKNTQNSQCRKLYLLQKDERKRPLIVPTFPLPPNNPCTSHTSYTFFSNLQKLFLLHQAKYCHICSIKMIVKCILLNAFSLTWHISLYIAKEPRPMRSSQKRNLLLWW